MIRTPSPAGTSRGRMSYINNFQQFTFLLLKRRWIQKLVFEDGGVQNISKTKIYRTPIISHSTQKNYLFLPVYKIIG